MERLDGTTLKVYMARKTLDTQEIADIAAQITEALAVAHGSSVIHRDIKPGWLAASTASPKVLDFGLARRAPAAPDAEVGMEDRRFRTTAQTPAGMAPERIPDSLDARAAGFHSASI
jgi:serine/threonine protein kinase